MGRIDIRGDLVARWQLRAALLHIRAQALSMGYEAQATEVDHFAAQLALS